MTKCEIDRQNCIFELIETEKQFVTDLENTIKIYIDPLLNLSIIQPQRKMEFMENVFSNYKQVKNISSKFCSKFIRRQNESAVIDKISDIFLDIYNFSEVYLKYATSTIRSIPIINNEKQTNPTFLKFLQSSQKAPELRKLSLDNFILSPTTRLPRYILHINAIIDKFPTHHDCAALKESLKIIRKVVGDINKAVGKANDILKIKRLTETLLSSDYGAVEVIDLLDFDDRYFTCLKLGC
jgi:hypothetical protein